MCNSKRMLRILSAGVLLVSGSMLASDKKREMRLMREHVPHVERDKFYAQLAQSPLFWEILCDNQQPIPHAMQPATQQTTTQPNKVDENTPLVPKN